MQDFTAGGIHALPSQPQPSVGDAGLDARIKALVAESGCQKSCPLIEEMIATALKLGRDDVTVADLKLFNRSLKEMRYAARTFAPYRHHRKVVVFGSARTPYEDPDAVVAEQFAQRMRELDYMIITGGGRGIMGAAQRGAGREASFGLNIKLPFEQSANETIEGDRKLVTFNYFFTRKLSFVKEAHALALCPGGLGTMDEGFEVLTLIQTGKARILPVVMLEQAGGNYWSSWLAFLRDHLLSRGLISEWDFNLFKIVHSVEEAVAEITKFYHNYNSYRWIGRRMVIRMQRRLTDESIRGLNERFASLLTEGTIEQCHAQPEEKNEPELAHMPRLILAPNRRLYGVLRQLIDAVNEFETVETPVMAQVPTAPGVMGPNEKE